MNQGPKRPKIKNVKDYGPPLESGFSQDFSNTTIIHCDTINEALLAKVLVFHDYGDVI